MAQRNLDATNYGLFIDPAGGTDYSMIVCLISQTLNRTTETLDSGSKCGVSSGAGKKSADVSFEGVLALDPDSGNISGSGLHDLWDASTVFGWKIGRLVPIAGDVTYSATGYLTSLSDTYPIGDGTFSGAFAVSSNIVKVVEAES